MQEPIDDVETQIAGFIAKFAEPMQDRIKRCRAAMQARFPHAVELVYDNYNFFVIGFGPTTRTSESIFSLASYRAGINLFFLHRGPDLPDPTHILRGNGKVVRSIPLASPDDLDRSAVAALIDAELALAPVPMHTSPARQVVVKSISAKQRPRR